MRVRTATPASVKLLLLAAISASATWWVAQARDRAGNEARLGAVVSAIAGREVRVRCPGVVGRIVSWDIVEGSVRFDAAGRPADETKLRAFACAELDALAEGRRTDALACARAGGTGCGTAAPDLALAVNVLAHEAWHLAGIADEAVAECRALQTLAKTAGRLGVAPSDARVLATTYLATGHRRLPDRYRSGACADGEALDLRPGDPSWP